LPFAPRETLPLGWTQPYSSFTAYVAVLTPDVGSVIVPEIVMGTILPSGGHRVAGDAEAVSAGGLLSILIRQVALALLPALSLAVPVIG